MVDNPPLPQELYKQMTKHLPALPSYHHLYIEAPLYKPFKYDPAQLSEVRELVSPNKIAIDCHCIECAQPSVFHSPAYDAKTSFARSQQSFGDPAPVTVTLRCTRNENHRLIYQILVGNGQLMKIGQFPSVADLSEQQIKEYRGVLGPERYRELHKAVGLASHGVGIGAFVYLRRIFEWLLVETFQEAKAAGHVTDEEYRPVRVEQKIELLNDHLPRFMVQNSHLYGIVSKGVHELTEEECLTHFATVRTGIEVILDQWLENKKRKEKIAAAEKEINLLNQRLKK